MSNLFDFLTREFHNEPNMGHGAVLAAENCNECRRIARTVSWFLEHSATGLRHLTDRYAEQGPYAVPEGPTKNA